eukprot:2617198-Pleurochrysis_carterae.AAC.1
MPRPPPATACRLISAPEAAPWPPLLVGTPAPLPLPVLALALALTLDCVPILAVVPPLFSTLSCAWLSSFPTAVLTSSTIALPLLRPWPVNASAPVSVRVWYVPGSLPLTKTYLHGTVRSLARSRCQSKWSQLRRSSARRATLARRVKMRTSNGTRRDAACGCRGVGDRPGGDNNDGDDNNNGDDDDGDDDDVLADNLFAGLVARTVATGADGCVGDDGETLLAGDAALSSDTGAAVAGLPAAASACGKSHVGAKGDTSGRTTADSSSFSSQGNDSQTRPSKANSAS